MKRKKHPTLAKFEECFLEKLRKFEQLKNESKKS